eukprot:scaffold138485_cov22-Tisochrysis_lutea.AAC.2
MGEEWEKGDGWEEAAGLGKERGAKHEEEAVGVWRCVWGRVAASARFPPLPPLSPPRSDAPDTESRVAVSFSPFRQDL